MPSQKKILVVTQHFWPENFRINDIVEGFLQDGIAVDVLCGLPNYPKGEWFDGYSADGPFEEVYKGARVFRAREIPRKGNTGKTIFLNYVSWPLYAAGALKRLPGGYDAVFCFNTSPVLMCWPAIRYAKKHHIPFTNYVLDIWPENLYSVLNVKNKALRAIAQGVSDALYKKADRLIAMSEPLQQRLCQRTGMPPQKIAVIPQYCEDFYAVPQPDAALQAQFGGRFNLVFTGTFTPAQSLETVITAVQDARGGYVAPVAGGRWHEPRRAGSQSERSARRGHRYVLRQCSGNGYPQVHRAGRCFDRLPVGFAGLGADRTGQGCQLYGRRQAGPGQYGRCR